MRIFYTTICDSKYIGMALALYRSLEQACRDSLGIYTLDNGAADCLNRLDLPNAHIFRLDEYVPEEVLKLIEGRSAGSRAFTLKSYALMHALRTHPNLDWVVYFDVDIKIFSDPAQILLEIPEQKAVSIAPHRSSKEFVHYEPNVGRFNAGYLAFKNNQAGLVVLKRWQEMCLSWCHDYVENNRFGDQKYFDDLVDVYDAIAVCDSKGVNAAPWNISGVEVTQRDGKVYVDGVPLVFYHFHGLRVYGTNVIDLFSSRELIVSTGGLYQLIYKPYVGLLKDAYVELQKISRWRPVYARPTLKRRLGFIYYRLQGKSVNLCRVV